jgi:polygalacturonase
MRTATAQQYYNVLTYGAKNDSSKIATKSIANAIAAAVKKGGGTIYFPPENILQGPFILKAILLYSLMQAPSFISVTILMTIFQW